MKVSCHLVTRRCDAESCDFVVRFLSSLHRAPLQGVHMGPGGGGGGGCSEVPGGDCAEGMGPGGGGGGGCP